MERFNRILAVALAIAFWQLAAMAVGMEILLASPLQVFARLCTIWQEPGFCQTIGFSMGRIVAGYLLALGVGLLFGAVAGRFPLVETLLRPYVVVMKTVPAASFIILALIWFSFTQLTIFVSFLIAFPVIYSNVVSGIRSADPKLLEMAHLYQVPLGKKLRCIYLPALRPFLMSSLSVAMGMAWKAGVAAEVIGIVDGSIGGRLYEAKVYFQNADLLAWTVILVLLSLLLEKVTTGTVLLSLKKMKNVEKSRKTDAKSDKGTVLLSPKKMKNVEKSRKTDAKSDKRTVPLSLKDLRKCFDGEAVISGLNLELPLGRRYCLRGPSGFGKTTLLRMIAGILAPDEGTITRTPTRVAFVFQEDRLCEDFSAADNVALVTGDTMTRTAIETQLEEVGLLQNSLSRPVSTFSGGMKRRVAIVRAICYDADLLLLDEPFKGLDPQLHSQVADYILRHTAGKTLICVSHDDTDALLLHAENIDLCAETSEQPVSQKQIG